MNAEEEYGEILGDNLFSSEGEIQLDFQQDNDLKHPDKATQKQFIDNKVDVLEWPGPNPDLSHGEFMTGLEKRCQLIHRLQRPDIQS